MQANDTLPNLQAAKALGCSSEEFERVKEILARMPNMTELRIFAALWSERCSNKNAGAWLKTLPRESKNISPASSGRAAILELDRDIACTLRLQSLPLPPYLNATNGIGALLRDTLSEGARPFAAMSVFRFGHLKDDRTRDLMRDVVQDLSSHTNGLGVPMLKNEACFNDSNTRNTVLAVLSLGLIPSGKTIPSATAAPGAPVFLVGAPTQKNDFFVHRAEDGSQPATSYRPVAGNPLLDKCLLEATLEAAAQGSLAGIQSLDAGGLAQASARMAVKLGAGLLLHADRMHTGPENLAPHELVLSETQGRILMVGQPDQEETLVKIFEKWDLLSSKIGEVTKTEQLEFLLNGERFARVPAYALLSGAPAPDRSYKRPDYLKKIENYKLNKIKKPDDYLSAARRVFNSPNIASKKWLNEQFDSLAQTNNVNLNVLSDASLLRVKGSNRILALTTTYHMHYLYADPYAGAMIAVSSAARKIVCSGGEPMALACSLNFGDPADAESYWTFVQVVKGMTDACRKLGIPVISEHVNFQPDAPDEKQGPSFRPCAVFGMAGLVEEAKQIIPAGFQKDGHQIYMIGTPHNDLGSSAYLRIAHGVSLSPPPVFELDEEYHIQRNLRIIHRNGFIQSAHHIGEGGLFASLLECAMIHQLGFDIETDTNFRKDAYLFGESQSRIVVTTTADDEDELVNYLNSNNVPFTKLGEVTGQNASIDGQNLGDIAQWKGRYESLLYEQLGPIL